MDGHALAGAGVVARTGGHGEQPARAAGAPGLAGRRTVVAGPNYPPVPHHDGTDLEAFAVRAGRQGPGVVQAVLVPQQDRKS
jgi:hypothetical protein